MLVLTIKREISGGETKLFLLWFVSVALYVVVLVGLLFVSVSPLFVLLVFHVFRLESYLFLFNRNTI